MRFGSAVTGSAVFFALAPGTVAGFGPWWLTGWRLRPGFLPVRVLGVVLLAAGAVILVHAFARFVVDGLGTPAPVAAPERLVVTGIYRHVRNPMYLAVVAAVLGQAAILGQPALLGYAAVVGAAMVAFVLGYEQPALSEQFGAEYDAYRRAVPGWWPRLHPWRPS